MNENSSDEDSKRKGRGSSSKEVEKRVFRKRWMEFPKTVDGIRDDGKDGVGKF